MIKVWEFLKKNWTWLTVIPALFIMLSWGIRWYVKMLTDRNGNTDTDLHKADVKLKTDTAAIDGKTQKDVDLLKKERDNLSSNIDKGDPSAADVMNDALGIGKGEKK